MSPRILDRSFKYVPAINTDLRSTFARIREDLSRQRTPAPKALPEHGAQIKCSRKS